MDVNTSYSNSTATAYQSASTANQSAQKETAAAVAAKETTQTEAYVNDVNTSKKDSTAYKPDWSDVQKLVKESNVKLDAFRSMVEKLITKQGGVSNNIWGDLKSLAEKGEADPATAASAQDEIGEDGYYGVKQTSERIFEFAKAISGGDPSKLDALKEAIDKGFKAAEKAWGSTLPDICKQTYDAVMKKLDDWASESK